MKLSIDRQYGDRLSTDKQVIDIFAKRDFHGLMGEAAKFIEKNQLLKRSDWELFVKQFETMSDSGNNGWRGEYFGKMMRGASMTYSYTKNEELYELLTDIAQQMLKTQDSYGRFSTYKADIEFKGWDIWSRKYVILGFLHYYEICRDEGLKKRILDALIRHLDYVCSKIGRGKRDIGATSSFWLCINSASILEPTLRMYNLTGKEEYLDFAEYIIEYLTESRAKIFKLALDDEILPYQYPVVKAYEMMSCFEGLLEYYRITKKEWALLATRQFADRVRESEISIIGCAGCEHELFNNTVGKQTDTDYVGIMQETCVTVTWMKLCNQLLTLTGEAKYATYIEESYYNALLGSINTDGAGEGFCFDSYSPLFLGSRGRAVGGRMYFPEGGSYGCCVAIGAAGTALPLLTAITATKDGVALNYYENGRVEIGGFVLEIKTDYPLSGKIEISVISAPCEKSEIALRVPYFGGEATEVFYGEENIFSVTTPDSYCKINRAWKAGESILVKIDMNPRIVRPKGCMAIDKTRKFLALKYGPLVMARDKRVTEVGTTVTPGELKSFEIGKTDKVRCNLFAKAKIGECTLELIDYASAGKTLDEGSLTEAWLPTDRS